MTLHLHHRRRVKSDGVGHLRALSPALEQHSPAHTEHGAGKLRVKAQPHPQLRWEREHPPLEHPLPPPDLRAQHAIHQVGGAVEVRITDIFSHTVTMDVALTADLVTAGAEQLAGCAE